MFYLDKEQDSAENLPKWNVDLQDWLVWPVARNNFDTEVDLRINKVLFIQKIATIHDIQTDTKSEALLVHIYYYWELSNKILYVCI